MIEEITMALFVRSQGAFQKHLIFKLSLLIAKHHAQMALGIVSSVLN